MRLHAQSGSSARLHAPEAYTLTDNKKSRITAPQDPVQSWSSALSLPQAVHVDLTSLIRVFSVLTHQLYYVLRSSLPIIKSLISIDCWYRCDEPILLPTASRCFPPENPHKYDKHLCSISPHHSSLVAAGPFPVQGQTRKTKLPAMWLFGEGKN